MKSILKFLFCFNVALSFEVCNKDLLFSYGVKTPQYRPTTSMLCGGGEKETCCSHIDESFLLEKWNTTNKKLIKPYLDGYTLLTKLILNYYEDIIVLSKYVFLNPKSSDECKQAADHLILNYLYKEEIVNYTEQLEKFMRSLSVIRKGFYCQLCSVKNQKYFNSQEKRIVFQNDFCENIVEQSIEYQFYRTQQILPILNSINTILDCKDGTSSNEEMQILLDNEELAVINKCYKSYKNFKDPLVYINSCVDYCKKFSLTTAQNLIEGSFVKLDFIYQKILASNLKCTDPDFPDLDMDSVYKFEGIRETFYQNSLNFQDLNKYESTFENYGLTPFDSSVKSLFFYGDANNMLNDFKQKKKKGISSLMKMSIFVMSYFILLI